MQKVVSQFQNFREKTRINQPLLAGIIFIGCLCSPAFADNYDIGLKLYGQGNYEMAARYFLQAAGRSDNPNVHYYLADTYLKMDRLAEAQAEYQKVLAIAPDTQAAKLSRAGLQHLREYLNGTHESSWQQAGGSGVKAVADRYVGAPINGEDYLDLVTEGGKMVRWSLKKMPLRVFIETSPQGIRNFQPAYGSRVRQALDVWANILDHQISFVPTTNKDQADLRISWVNNIDTKGHSDDGGTSYTAGLTIPHINNDQLMSMDIKLATFDIEGHAQSSDTIYAVAIHEVGHSLGILGHSDNPDDIMFARNEHVVVLTKRDSNTIRRLYSATADIDNLSPDNRQIDPKRQTELIAKMDEDIKRLETQAKKDDMALSWLNLGVAYFQKAKGLSADHAADSNALYEKSLDATSKAIQQEPNNAFGYHKRSLVYQELQDYGHALQDVQHAITLDHREPEYYMLQAWFMANLGQNSEARSSLNTYLLYKPSEAASQDVTMIKALLQKNAAAKS